MGRHSETGRHQAGLKPPDSNESLQVKLDSKLTWRSDAVCMLGESPVWDPHSGTLHWIDVVDPAIYAYVNHALRRYAMPKPVASIYLAQSGRLLAALRSGFVWLDLSDACVAPLAGAWPMSPDERFNDGRCDRHGAVWISTMDRRCVSRIGAILRIASATDARAFPSHAILGNGICFSPDDRFLYFSDTHARTIHRYEKAGLMDGQAADGRLFVQAAGGSGKPDGSAMDSDGCLWSASVGGGRIERYSPEGRLVGVLDLPVSHPTHCAFGDSDLRTLFVTTMGDPRIAPALAGQPLAGRVLAFQVQAQGMPEQRLAATWR